MENKNELILAPGTFPLNASDLKLFKYAATGTLGHMEEEEAAVRLLMFSQKDGNFVGVAWNDVMGHAAKEAMAIAEHNEIAGRINDSNYMAMQDFYAKRKVYRTWAFCTLGVSLLFMESPVQPMQKAVPQLDKSLADLFSIVTLYGAMSMQMLINAYHKLIDLGLVTKEERNGTDYFFPTPNLVAKIAGI